MLFRWAAPVKVWRRSVDRPHSWFRRFPAVAPPSGRALVTARAVYGASCAFELSMVCSASTICAPTTIASTPCHGIAPVSPPGSWLTARQHHEVPLSRRRVARRCVQASWNESEPRCTASIRYRSSCLSSRFSLTRLSAVETLCAVISTAGSPYLASNMQHGASTASTVLYQSRKSVA